MAKVQSWWFKDYAVDIYVYMRHLECQRMDYKGLSPQLHYRKELVDLISLVCNYMGFCHATRHLSVHLLDFYMDEETVDPMQIEPLALGCLSVAAKVEEANPSPKLISELSRLMEYAYTRKDIVKAELDVLEFFNWNVHHPTAAQFLEYFAAFALLPDHSLFLSLSAEGEQLFESLKENLHYFLDASLKDPVFHQMAPSMVAASCVACARICLHLHPIWSRTLQEISDYTLDQLAICANLLMMAKERGYARNRTVAPWPEEIYQDWSSVGLPYYYDHYIMAAQHTESRREERRAALWPIHTRHYEF